MKRARSALALAAWSAALAAALVLLDAADSGGLAAPPLTGRSALREWLAAREPAVAAVAVLRLGAVACCWYLVLATSVCIAAGATRLPGLVRASRLVSVPSVRRMVNAALGAGMVATTWVAPVAASEMPPSEPPVLRWIDSGTSPAGTTEPAEDVAPSADPDVAIPPPEAPRKEAPHPPPVSAGEPVPAAPAGAAGAVEPARPTGPADRADGAAQSEPEVEPEPAARTGAPAPPPPSPVGRASPAARAEPVTAPDAPAPAAGTWAVEPGDSFWRIARVHLERTSGRAPATREVVPYWRALIDTNRDELVDPANPNLLLVGQTLTLPPP